MEDCFFCLHNEPKKKGLRAVYSQIVCYFTLNNCLLNQYSVN